MASAAPSSSSAGAEQKANPGAAAAPAHAHEVLSPLSEGGPIDPTTLSRRRSLQTEDEEKILMEPFDYLNETRGKNVRNTLIDAFQSWLKIPADKLDAVKSITESLHNASLLIDDIEDRSILRRGRPVAHLLFGEPATINCANYVYFTAMDQCRKLNSKEALDCFLDEMLNLHRGQGLDIYWRDRNECPTVRDYERMVMNKTGGLFRLSIGLMQAFSANKKNFYSLANNLGLFFQIRDDYANLQVAEYTANKTFAEDLTEGKFSFPILLCVLAMWPDHKLLNILKQRTENVSLKKYAIDLMRESKAFEQTIERMVELRVVMLQQIEELGGNATLVGLVTKLSDGILPPLSPPSQQAQASSSTTQAASAGSTAGVVPAAAAGASNASVLVAPSAAAAAAGTPAAPAGAATAATVP